MQWEFNPSGAQATLDTSSRFAVQQTSTWRCLGQGAFFSLLEGNRRTWDPTKGTNPPNWPKMVKHNGQGPSPNALGVRCGTPTYDANTSHHAPTSTSTKTCTPRQTTTQPGINTVFLAAGYENHAFDPHSLIIAGDVEQNPGPIQPAKQPVCHGCEMRLHPSPSTPSIYLQPSAMREELPQGRKIAVN